MAYVDLANRVYNGPSYMDLGAPSGVVWDARLDLLPLSTTANASTLRAALAAMGLTLTRASAATVQTSASEVVTSGIGVDDPRVGRYGLVIEEARTNYNPKARSFLVVDGWTNGGAVITGDAMAGPDGSVSADRQQAASGAFGVYRTVLSATSYTTASMWRRSGTGAVASHAWFIVDGANAASNQNNALGATWERSALTIASPGGGVGPISTCDGRTLGAPYNLTAGARDAALDLLQVEVGKFATEAILTTGAAATRAVETLRYRDTGLVRSGRMRLELDFIAKGDSSAPSLPALVYFDASNYVYHRAGADNRITLFLGGVSGTTSGTVTWNAYQRVRLFLEFGNGSSSIWSKIDEAAAQQTTSASVAGSLPSVAPYIMSGAGATPLSSWLQRIRAYAPGRRPSWCA